MDNKHQALFQLERLVMEHPEKIRGVYNKYGEQRVPVNMDTLASMVVLHKKPFIDDLYTVTRPYTVNGYEGQTETKSKFQQWVDKAAGLIFGLDNVVNPEPEEPEPDEKEKTLFLGLPIWAWVLIVLVIVIVIVAVVYAKKH